jgi:hypothetical protein
MAGRIEHHHHSFWLRLTERIDAESANRVGAAGNNYE